MPKNVSQSESLLSEDTVRRVSSGLKWLEQSLVEWRQSGAFGELGVSFMFEGGNVRVVKKNVQQLSK